MKITKIQLREMIREELLLEIPGKGSKIYKVGQVKISLDTDTERVTIEDRRNEIKFSIREVDDLIYVLQKIFKGWKR